MKNHLIALYNDGWECACGFITQSDAHAREHIARAELGHRVFQGGPSE